MIYCNGQQKDGLQLELSQVRLHYMTELEFRIKAFKMDYIDLSLFNNLHNIL